jgi:acyl carrier protein
MAVDKARVIELIVEQLDADSDNISDDDSFMDDLGADSLDTVELIMAFEEEFDIEIPDEDAENIRTVGDVLKYLEDKL